MKKKLSYQPVSCDLHSELELSIMQGKNLHIQFFQDEDLLTTKVKPVDIVSRKGQGEFLLAVDESGQGFEIRLDYIHKFHPL